MILHDIHKNKGQKSLILNKLVFMLIIYFSREALTYMETGKNLRLSIPRLMSKGGPKENKESGLNFVPFSKKGRRFKQSSEVPHKARVSKSDKDIRTSA